MVQRFNPRLPGGRRHQDLLQRFVRVLFQSTPSGGKATDEAFELSFPNVVSIHAFRGEGDATRALAGSLSLSFNPRLPGGRRLLHRLTHLVVAGFNPRLPGGRRQPSRWGIRSPTRCFNPRLPGGRRHRERSASVGRWAFQSTPSGGKATGVGDAAPTGS